MLLSFKTFINKYLSEEENIATNRRQGITHLRDMKPVIFIEWLDSVKKEANGALDSRTAKAALKIDGSNFKFGKGPDGTIFVEAARSGAQTEVGAFFSYASGKGSIEPILVRAQHYDDILASFKKNKSLMDLLPNNTKVYCELFYVPMAELEDETGVQFVTVKYDKNKIGNLMTLALYDVFYADTGTRHDDAESIKKILISKGSTKDIKIISADLDFKNSIDINAEIDLMDSLLHNKAETLRILQSRTNADKEAKANLVRVIDNVKSQLEKKILFNPNFCGLDRLCSPSKGEGLVLNLYKEFGTIKVINPEFEQQHHGK